MFLITAGKVALAFLLLLGGIKFVSSSLREITGGFFYHFLKKYTARSWSGFLLGVLTTFFLQSSSLVSVMVVGFINGGFLNLKQGLCIVIGANIGTTLTSQLFSMETRFIILPFILSGILLFILEVLLKKSLGGKVLLGIAAVLTGIEMFSVALKPLSNNIFLKELLLFSKDAPWKGIITGAAAAAILQSSSVTIGTVVLLAKEKVLGLPEAIAMIMGADVGTCITSFLASIGTILPARQVAWGHLFFNLLCILLVLPFWKYFLWLIKLTSNDCSRQVANAHAVYNLLGALAFLPVVDIYAKLLQNIIGGEK